MSRLRKPPIFLSAFGGDKFTTNALLRMLPSGSFSEISDVRVWHHKKGCCSVACSADTGKGEWICNAVDTDDGFRKALVADSVHLLQTVTCILITQ